MKTLFKDLRYGIRNLLKQPVFALVAVSTLGLAIGANSAMFTVVNAVLLRPLQYPEPDRLVWLEASNPPRGITFSNMSVPDLMDWQSQNQAFEQMAGFFAGGHFLNGDDPERVRSALVTSDFFSVFRMPSLLGRTLQPDDVEPGRNLVVVISHGLWQRRFGADPAVIGRQVGIGSRSATLVGVMPKGFDYPAQSEMWLPLPLDPADSRDDRYLNGVARLKPGANIPQAQAELDTINQRLAQSYSATNTGWTVRVSNLQDQLVGNVRRSLLVLLCAVIFVLLIACANIANLLLARSTSRQKEIAVRAALGASRFRIIRQLLTESLILSLVGGAFGLLLSFWLTKLLIAISPANSPRFDEIRPDARVFVFTIGLTIVTSLVFGLAPALQASRSDQSEALKEGSRGNAGGARSNRIRSGLMVAEIAMSFMLLAGAGLLIKSFLHLREVTPGFTPENVLTVRVSGPPGKFKEDANETTARRLWPGESPLGRRVTISPSEKFQREIVGVVGETKAALDNEPGEQMYVPFAQDASWPSMSVVIRTSGDPANFSSAVRNEIRSLDKAAPVFNVRTMNDLVATSVAPRRTPMLLLSAFAGAALMLAMMGIYGVTAYYVTQRTQEIGIRMALGAQMSDVLKLVLKGGMVLAIAGIATGLVGAFVLTRWMTTLLFGVKPTDWVTFAAVSACLLVTALLACYLPARRARKVDPLVALRYE